MSPGHGKARGVRQATSDEPMSTGANDLLGLLVIVSH